MGERERSVEAQQARAYVAANLKRYRAKQGLTQAQLASRLQIELRHLQFLESGQSAPGMDLLVDLAVALKVQVGQLFEPVEATRPRRGRPTKHTGD